jgi:hypothetical protein
LRHDAEAQESLLHETSLISTKTVTHLASLCIQKSADINGSIRDGVNTLLSRISIDRLDETQAREVFDVASELLVNLKNGFYGEMILSNVTESLTDTLNELVDIKSRDRHAWARIINNFKKLSESCDRDCQNSVNNWIEKQKEV